MKKEFTWHPTYVQWKKPLEIVSDMYFWQSTNNPEWNQSMINKKRKNGQEWINIYNTEHSIADFATRHYLNICYKYML